MIGFDRNDFCLRSQAFDGERHTCEQASAADWHNDRVEIGDLFDNLQAHCALTGDDRGIVVAIDVSESSLLRDFVRLLFRFGKIFSVEHHSRAEFLAIPYLN